MTATDDKVRPVGLRTQDRSGLIATGFRSPRLSWKLEATRESVRQLGYEVETADDADFARAVASSGFVEASTPFDAAWPGAPLASRQTRWARVRIHTDRGQTAWSEPLRVEAALLDETDWTARPISPVSNVGRREPAPVPLLRRAFTLPSAVARARLYVTALGIHTSWLNGAPVSNDLLDPGWTAYRGRHLYTAYDVTALLRQGENVIAAAVGDGWWRGELTWMQRRALYGETTALLAQLEIELATGEVLTVATDGNWKGATGGLLAADLYGGSDCDLRAEPAGWREAGFDDRGWESVATLPLPDRLELRSFPAVQLLDSFALPVPEGRLLVDCGQNLTGWLRLRARGPAGAKITVRHAEVLDDAGDLHTAALRNARATDSYVLDGRGTVELEPSFTYHGFRYAEITADPGIAVESIEVRVVTSDIHETGSFRCSEPLVERLFENIRWSQRGNFLALPTDCPQRDERLGWTGDIQVFADTACTNSDVDALLASWLKDLALEQWPDGRVTSTVPNVIQGHDFEYGGIGWGDAATLVPWAMHMAYGDREVLRTQYASMAAWVDWGASRLNEDGVWQGDFHLGDWLDPGAPPDKPEQATTDRDFIASAYLSRSAAVLAQSAELLGRDADARRYAELSAAVARASWRHWRAHALTTQAGCAIAIEFGIAPPEERTEVGAALAALVARSEGRIATGFLGTPLVLPALTRTGQVDAAYRVLLNRETPGWLFQVLRGGTTMWERWDAIRDDGTIHPGDMASGGGSSMMSFNHYAYGSVGAWLYASVAGIAPALPGYEAIDFHPQPGGGLTHAEAEIETPYGHAAIAWRADDDGGLDVELTIPPGATGRFRAPDGWLAAEDVELNSGRHRFVLEPMHDA